MAETTRNPLEWIDHELAQLERDNLRRRLVHRTGPQSARLELAEDSLIDFSSNDYLGLANDPRLVTAAAEAMDEIGWGSAASPLITGRSHFHVDLERELAEFEGTEAALLFPSGYAANTGAIASLVSTGDLAVSDAKNHASIIDGCRLSRADTRIYPHGDCDALEKLLQKSSHRRKLVVTDSLFSMDGDLAPIDRLADLAEEYDAMLMVDEAHATGVFGPAGRGVVEHIEEGGTGPLHNRVHVRIGTLSKALGTAGGFVCGSQSLIDWLSNRARSYVFSTAHPPATASAGVAALTIVRTEPDRRRRLLRTASNVRERLAERGWNIGSSTSQIIPLFLGDAQRAVDLSVSLKAAGFLVPAIRPPSVPEGEALVRLSLRADHTADMIEGLLDALGDG